MSTFTINTLADLDAYNTAGDGVYVIEGDVILNCALELYQFFVRGFLVSNFDLVVLDTLVVDAGIEISGNLSCGECYAAYGGVESAIVRVSGDLILADHAGNGYTTYIVGGNFFCGSISAAGVESGGSFSSSDSATIDPGGIIANGPITIGNGGYVAGDIRSKGPINISSYGSGGFNCGGSIAAEDLI